MKEEFPIRGENKERIINDFRLIKFRCIRCGSKNIQINEIQPYADGINFHGRGQTANPKNEIELTFYVTALLFCKRCNHRFHMKILDQGTRNTNVYFDNMLT
jgi:DNA-directed RNA polymerase subunit RPC12/RpoP